MAARTSSEWRLAARRRIQSVLARLPRDADLKAKRRALREAYPFGERRYHPYRMWCSEVRAALGPAKKAEPATVDWEVIEKWCKPFYVLVKCGWCMNQVRTRGCLACGPRVDELTDLLASPDFMSLLKAVRADVADPLPRLVLADWLDERGYDQLAELFRATVPEE